MCVCVRKMPFVHLLEALQLDTGFKAYLIVTEMGSYKLALKFFQIQPVVRACV